MAKITGIAEVVRKNDKGIYSLKVDNVWYGFYKTDPKCREGDSVEFQAEEKGDFWNAKGPVKVLADEGSSSKPASSSASAPRSAYVPDDKRQKMINYQSARKDALVLMQIAQSAGLVDFGTKAKNKPPLETLESYVDMYTTRFFKDTDNLGHEEAEAPEADDFDTDEIPKF